MYSSLRLASKYASFLIKARSRAGHGIHSPFIFEFAGKILNDRQKAPEWKSLEKMRGSLKNDQRQITVDDLGAGSSDTMSPKRTVASIAKRALKSEKFAQLLFRMARYYQPSTILELGTSLGLTTTYLSFAQPGSTIFTLEGAPAVAEEARKIFKAFNRSNMKLVEGNFDYTLPVVLYQLDTVDFAFVDGNHRREPTLNYFNWILPRTHNETILVFDDIHWSGEMEEAWKEIKEHTAVRCTVDLFFIGIVFLRQEFREKQHFLFRY